MIARIKVSRTQDNENTAMYDYENELKAQAVFDVFTAKGNEHSGYLQWDLEVKHHEMGWITRRTMFTYK